MAMQNHFPLETFMYKLKWRDLFLKKVNVPGTGIVIGLKEAPRLHLHTSLLRANMPLHYH